MAAKFFDLKVDEFGFGLPPRAWGKKIGETIYSLNWLPFGGFVKIFGEDTAGENLTMRKTPINTNNANNTQIVEKELSYRLTGIFFDVQSELGKFAKEKQYGDVLEVKLKKEGIGYEREKIIAVGNKNSNIADFIIEGRIVIEIKSKNFLTKIDYIQTLRYLQAAGLKLALLVNFRSSHLKPKRILNSAIGIISHNSHEFVTSHRLEINADSSRSFSCQPAWKKTVIILAGVTMNFIFGWFLISAVLMIGTPEGVIITGVSENSPADVSGLKPGDRAIGFTGSLQFTEFIKENAGKEINFDVKRGSEPLSIRATPRTDPPPGEGALGISLTDGGGRLGFFTAILEGFKTTIALIGLIFGSFAFLIKSLVVGGADLTGVVGPIGIFNVASEAGSLGMVYFLNLLALISINLGVINVLPFPALDGGRFLFIILEKIKGSPLPQKFEQLTNGIGFALLIALMIAITLRDISNLV